MIRKIVVFGLCAVILVGCGRDEADSTSITAVAPSGDAATTPFARINADTPWIFANLEPMPETLSELLWAPLKSMAELNRQTYTDLAEELDETPVLAALLREVAAIDSPEAMAERGLDPNGYWAIHGVSLYPFANWQVIDPAAFRATLERIIADAGERVLWRQIDGAEVLWAPIENLGVAIAWDEHFATVALIPDHPALLRRVANLDGPDEAYDPSELANFTNQRGYTPWGSGYIDSERVVEQLLDGDDETLSALRTKSQLGGIADNPVCRSELGALVDLFPFTSMGYTTMTGQRMAFDMTIETESSFAQRLQRLVDTPVSLQDQRAELFDFGFTLNIVAARDFARELVAGWVENPPQCELFSRVSEKADDWQRALNQPIPPIVTNFHGLRLKVDQVTMDDNSSFDAAEGTLALLMRNPQMMLGMAQMFSPELAAMQLEAGGEPQPIPDGVIPNLPEGIQAFFALANSGLGFAVGETQRNRLLDDLEPGGDDDTLFSYGIHFANYAQVLDGLLSGMRTELEDMGQGDSIRDADPSASLAALAELYEYTSASIHLSPRGIEFRSELLLINE